VSLIKKTNQKGEVGKKRSVAILCVFVLQPRPRKRKEEEGREEGGRGVERYSECPKKEKEAEVLSSEFRSGVEGRGRRKGGTKEAVLLAVGALGKKRGEGVAKADVLLLVSFGIGRREGRGGGRKGKDLVRPR